PAGRRPRGIGTDRRHARVRVRAPEEGERREAGNLQIVDVLTPTSDELRIFDPLERPADVRAHAQSRWLASRAPSESIRNFSHMMLGWTRAVARPCANPQSTPAMTFSRPTSFA